MPAKNWAAPGVLSEAAKGTPTITKVTVSTAAGQVLLAANPYRRVASFFNADASKTVWINTTAIGDTSTGYPIPAGTSFQDARTEIAWYACVATGTADVRVLEVAAEAT